MDYRIVTVRSKNSIEKLIIEPTQTVDEIAEANPEKIVGEVALEGTWDNCPVGKVFIEDKPSLAEIKPSAPAKPKAKKKAKPKATAPPEPAIPTPPAGFGDVRATRKR